MRNARRDEGAFTLIELMIVMAIVGILAMIAMPRFAKLLEKAREGATKGNISALRGAAKIYYTDRGGIWPSTLSSDAGYEFSAYISILPTVKCNWPSGACDESPAGGEVRYLTGSEEPNWCGRGWAYDSNNGNIFVNSTGNDSRGDSYTTY